MLRVIAPVLFCLDEFPRCTHLPQRLSQQLLWPSLLARRALNITMNTKSKAVLERVRSLCGALEPWKETEEVKDLEKQLDTTLAIITAGGTS